MYSKRIGEDQNVFISGLTLTFDSYVREMQKIRKAIDKLTNRRSFKRKKRKGTKAFAVDH